MGDVTNIADMTNLGDMTNFGGEDYTAEDMEMDTTIPVGELSFDSEQLLAQLEAERLQLRAELDRQRALQDAPAPAMSESPIVAPIGRAQRVPAPASRPASPVQEAPAAVPNRAARVSTSPPSRQASPVRPAVAPPARRASRVLAPPIEVPQPASPSRRSSVRMPGAAVWDEEVLVPVEERRTSLARPPTPPPVRRRASVVEESASPRRESVARVPTPPPARRPEPAMTKRDSIAPVPVEQPAPPPRRESVTRAPSPPARRQSVAVQPQATSTAPRRVVSPPPPRPVAGREERPAAAQLAPRRVSVGRQPTPPAPARRESVRVARPASPEVLVQPPPSRRGSIASTHRPSPPRPPQSAQFEDVFMDDDDEEEENYNFAQEDEDKTLRTRRGSASVYSYEPAQPPARSELYPTLDVEPPRSRPSRAHTVYYEPTPATSRPSMSYHEDRRADAMQISPPRLRRPSAGVLPTFLEQQQRVDDMFQRRVRDSNSHKGVELSPERLSLPQSRPASALDMQSGTRSRANSFTSRSRPASPVTRSRSMSRSRPASPSRSRSRPPSPVARGGRSMSAAPDLSFHEFHEERPSRPTSRSGGYAGPTATSKSRTAPRRSTSVPPPQSRKEAPKSRPAAKTTTSTTTSSRLMKETASSRARALRDKDVNKGASRRGEVDRERGRTKDVKKDLTKTSTSTTASRPPATATSKPPAARPRQEQKKKPVEVAKAVSARTAPRGILKAKPTTKPKLPASQLTRALAAKPSGSGSGPKLRDALAEPVEKQDANSGPAFADVIAKYGERLLKASGLAWITDPQADNATAPTSAPAATTKPTIDTAPRTAQLSDREADGDEEASESEPEHDPYRAMTLDDLSPRKRRAMHHQEDLQHHHPSFVPSPMRPSFKRSSDSYSPEPYKRARPPPSSPTPSSSPPSPEPPRARSRSRSRGPDRPLSRNGVAGGSMSREREFKGSGSVASQMVASASWDMPGYANKQRVLEKLEIERMRKELEAQARRAAGAPDYPVVPVIAPAHHTGTKPTVTQPFTFQASRQQRKEDFEAKRQLWQERSESVQSHASSHSSRSAPDFGSIHAANAASLASRRPKAQPTVPAAPKLSTTTRARERERYEEGHRERERIVEEYRAERRRLREMEEEREYREMRKRTVPKAHEVPAWYAEAPKRSVSGDARRR
ncbi:hypothetical protein EXIGLDRAFT_719742 [Exidia glandulosa HHB12029]|uniref:TPX2 C-terminal domain-containing protein n=1 Tax=Exidia glandulosa HHB12029 TaxID=1314781 RepID=A0A165GU31_EXIGL|nr:hypothetical protein EXIGLDRAFT_719742 [Exidia glandulosa HHB12029]